MLVRAHAAWHDKHVHGALAEPGRARPAEGARTRPPARGAPGRRRRRGAAALAAGALAARAARAAAAGAAALRPAPALTSRAAGARLSAGGVPSSETPVGRRPPCPRTIRTT